jgi:hypothetical protein
MKFISKMSVFALLILTVFGIAGFAIWKSVQSKTVEQVSIQNKTSSLVVESVKGLDKKNNRNEVEITFRNNYDKSVAAYRVRVSEEFNGETNVSAVERGGLIVGWVLRPNETKVEKFILNSEGKSHLTIAAVIFEDGTGDGEIVELNRLQEIRAGVRIAFQKIVPLLREAAKTQESFLFDTAIQPLEEKIKQLDDEDVPDNSKRGFALAQSYINLELKDIKEAAARNSNFNAKAEFAGKLSEIESALTKLSVNLPSNKTKEKR